MTAFRQEKLLSLPFGNISARFWGTPGCPRVLALHGWLDNSATFDRLIPQLEELELVAIDLPGHGFSDHRAPALNYHFVDWIPEIIQVLDCLQWEKCSLMGHSLGGAIATLVAASFPKRVQQVALIESLGPLSQPESIIADQLRKHVESWIALPKKKLPIYQDLEDATRARQKAGNLSLIGARVLTERGTKPTEGGVTWRSDPRLKVPSAFRMSEPQVLAFIRAIQCTVLVIRAKHGLPFDEKIIKERLKAFSSMTLEEIEGGHHVHLDSPDVVSGLLKGFFKD